MQSRVSNKTFLFSPPSPPLTLTGPFIDAVFRKVENMMQNSLYINLLVTGLLTRLAYYPQPLLRSFLLNTSMVFQPSVRSLVQVCVRVISISITQKIIDLELFLAKPNARILTQLQSTMEMILW